MSVEFQADISLRGISKSWLSMFQRWMPRRLLVAQKCLNICFLHPRRGLDLSLAPSTCEYIKGPVVTQVSDGSLLPPCPNLFPQSASLVSAGWTCWSIWRWCFFPGAPYKHGKLQEQLSSSTLTVTLTACGVTPACQKAKKTPGHAE